MTKNQILLLSAVILVAMLGYAATRYQNADIPKHGSVKQSEARERFERWAYTAKEKRISPSETVRLIVIPDATGIDVLDTKCLIYSNSEYKTSQFQCLDSNSMLLSQADQ